MKGLLVLALAAVIFTPACHARRLRQASTPRGTGRAASAGNSNQVVTTSITTGDTTAQCKTFSPSTFDWGYPIVPQEYGASGNSQPSISDVETLTRRICSNPQSAGQQILKMVQAGGQQAQTAVYAIFNADCPRNQQAGSDAYGAAVNAINSGDPSDLQATASFLSNLAAAADAVGIPICASLALVDQVSGDVLQQQFFHTSGGAAGPAAEGAAASNETQIVTSSLAYDSSLAPVPCDTFDPSVGDFVTNDTSTLYGARNTTQPPPSLVLAVQNQICSDPSSAGAQLQSAIQAGGSEAQIWAYGLLLSDCQDPAALQDTYHNAISAVNAGGNPENLPAVEQWFQNLAAAADAVGIPLCATVALVDGSTGDLIEESNFHTNG